jgi:hypothetical protein
MNVKTTKDFDREAKRLAKKYHSLAKDIRELREDLLENPIQGDALGDNCYKVRMSISSKNKGKSGGARVIICVKIIEDTIHLLYIFDKSEIDNISDAFLKDLIKTTS